MQRRAGSSLVTLEAVVQSMTGLHLSRQEVSVPASNVLLNMSVRA